MNSKLTLSTLALFAAASTAWAQFEGTLEWKMSRADAEGNKQEVGTMSVAIAKAGTRSEMDMHMGGMGMKVIMLLKSDTPDIAYRIDDANKTYSEMDLAKARAAGKSREEKVSVKKLGEEKILGYNTQHVLVTMNSGNVEMWTAKDFLDYATYSKLQMRRQPGGEALEKALKDAGAEGMPLKSVMGDPADPSGGKVTMEVVKAEKKSLPASMFEIPAGYTKSAGGMMGGMGGPGADAARQRMQDALKNMPAEQREKIEQMMKQRSGQ